MRTPGLALLALLITAPLAEAQPPGAGASGEAAILVYHAWPDPRAGTPEADPFATPRAAGTPAFREDARLPATRFDAATAADASPEGRPESALAHFREFQRLLTLRAQTGAPATLVLEGRVENGTLEVETGVVPHDGAAPLDVSLVVFEDGVPYRTEDGARVARFVARATMDGFTADGATDASSIMPLDAAWEARRLGVVAIARDTSGAVVQAATWLATQDGPTRQETKAVLVEHRTATWCDACAPVDEALALLATRTGGVLLADGAASYARAPTPFALVGAAVGLGVGLAWLRRGSA